MLDARGTEVTEELGHMLVENMGDRFQFDDD